MNEVFSVIHFSLCGKKLFASQPLRSNLIEPTATKTSAIRFNRQINKAFSEAKMPGRLGGIGLDRLSIRGPPFLTPAELTLLFGLEAFELKCALARFPGFLVWTGQNEKRTILTVFQDLAFLCSPKGGSSERSKGSLEVPPFTGHPATSLPSSRLPENLFPSLTWAPFSLFFLY